MDEELMHHGILGQKWGVRRTPAQLGHAPNGSNSSETKKVSELSDKELQERINRIRMEITYKELVASQTPQKNKVVKKLLGEAFENLGRKTLGIAVNEIVNRINPNKKENNFDINDYKDLDVYKIDPDAVSSVLKWYQNASKITEERVKIAKQQEAFQKMQQEKKQEKKQEKN